MASASPLIWAWRAVLPSRRLSPQYGKKKRRYLPYNHQHLYFFLSEYLLALLGVGMWWGADPLLWLSSLFPILPRVPLPSSQGCLEP